MSRYQFAALESTCGCGPRQYREALVGALRTLARQVDAVVDRQRQRRALARLDQRLLRDVGITPEQACIEAGKPPWRD